MKWPDGMDVYPKTFPPMRSDRDTVVVGAERRRRSQAASQASGDRRGRPGRRAEAGLGHSRVEVQTPCNGYLVTLVDQAKVDGGRTLPLIDSASLATAKREIEAGGRGLAALAREALSGGNLDSAEQLAGEALQPQSQRSCRPCHQGRSRQECRPRRPAVAGGGRCRGCQGGRCARPSRGEPGDLNLQGDDAGIPPPDGAAAAAEHRARDNALEEQWQKDVQNTINKARSQVAVDPGVAESMIQRRSTI